MKKAINIYDYPCGSGKTTRMIQSFEVDRKYLVILPLLTEVDRVISQSKKVVFAQPHANDSEGG